MILFNNYLPTVGLVGVKLDSCLNSLQKSNQCLYQKWSISALQEERHNNQINFHIYFNNDAFRIQYFSYLNDLLLFFVLIVILRFLKTGIRYKKC